MSWQALEEELARWRDSGRRADFWWRDDDAVAPCRALGRLMGISRRNEIPLALAVVPRGAVPELFAGLGATVLQHGTDHRNRADPGSKKTEFPLGESDEEALGRLAAARARLQALAGAQFLAVLAPPWNRFRANLVPRLAAIGFVGLSGYGARSRAQPAPGVRETNTHVDIVDWHGGRGFIGEDAALRGALNHLAARRRGALDADEPTGLLTHHAVHDAPAWRFLERFFERTRRHGAHWRDAAHIFA